VFNPSGLGVLKIHRGRLKAGDIRPPPDQNFNPILETGIKATAMQEIRIPTVNRALAVIGGIAHLV
jgi:hypothetical protein